MIVQDTTAEAHLALLADLENHVGNALGPYEKFMLNGKTYYFTPGGFLYRKDPWSEEVCGFFCGFVTDEVWHYRTYSRW